MNYFWGFYLVFFEFLILIDGSNRKIFIIAVFEVGYMSHNQSRGDRTESSQYRKSGRSNQHRNFSGGGSKGSGSGGGATAPPPSSNNNPSLTSNRR